MLRSLHPIVISPPLLNSAGPWATDLDDIKELYNYPHTGAITIRTSLQGLGLEKGFNHDENIHQWAVFNPSTNNHIRYSKSPQESRPPSSDLESEPMTPTSSLNTLGYSPWSFNWYFGIFQHVGYDRVPGLEWRNEKPVIMSVTGTPGEIKEMCRDTNMQMMHYHYRLPRILLEINLSCPNIAGKDPPAYSMEELGEYLNLLKELKDVREDYGNAWVTHVGLKLPPYTYRGQFEKLISTLKSFSSSSSKGGSCPITFLTSTNTLGNSLLLSYAENNYASVLNSADGSGIGGLAGASIHAISLGNVKTLRTMLDACEEEDMRGIKIIGVGGVQDRDGFQRMRSVGADFVAVGTAVGRWGVGVFEKIANGEEEVEGKEGWVQVKDRVEEERQDQGRPNTETEK
jgi:dihydroorotate dehydrogenase (fumarate)